MRNCLEEVMLITFLVDVLLLTEVYCLYGIPLRMNRILTAACLGSAYAGVCCLPGTAQLGRWHIYLLVLLVAVLVAFGAKGRGIRCGCVFCLLRFSVSGISGGFSGRWVYMLCGAGVVIVLCIAAFFDKTRGANFLPVVMSYGGKTVRLTALEDTGNLLRDPVTGKSVLIVNASVAMQLLGLTKQQLEDPVKTVHSGVLPGLRLIPYCSVGSDRGLLLAKQLYDVEVGSKRGSALVAFSPAQMDSKDVYQALIGGAV